ncbi:MAG: sensor histidine kinase, partial [Oscillospiraceae bacterium]
AVVLSLLLARRISRRIIEPLNNLNLDEPLENDTYEELSPLLTRISRQHKQIELQLNELERRRNEFTAVTNNMSEGLVLLGSDGAILSMNKSAMKIFEADDSAIGRDILTVDRSLQLQKLLRQALAGAHSEANVIRGEQEYQLGASPISFDGHITGVVLLVFDVTEKAQSERMRREFSANVSHELKTPLHSIMGSAELIENGLVKEQDMPRFIGRIRSEAARLVTLIDDIIRLSQLDEAEPMQKEQVALLALAQEAADSLSPAAAERGISITAGGDNTNIFGVKRLIYEIIYNLCDNAVKYNKDGGSIKIQISGRKITVSDTGIGIAPEHQQRVFERFYRVDKSHSRETGGTGLGLSIVKHAAQYHGASIALHSTVGEGTSISVTFPEE